MGKYIPLFLHTGIDKSNFKFYYENYVLMKSDLDISLLAYKQNGCRSNNFNE